MKPAYARWPGWGRWLLRFGLPFLLLNALLGMENLWPTLWPHPAARLSFELCMAVLALTLWQALRGEAGAGLLRALALLTVGWIMVRYLEVTASAVFGRQIHLYWDGRHLFDVVRMAEAAWWQLALAGAAALMLLWLGYLVTRRCWVAIARAVAMARPRPLVGTLGVALLASFAAQGTGGRDTRWFFSMPVAPIIAGQVELLADQLLPGRAVAQLSPSPDFDRSLAGLAGADVLIVFAESYGVSTLDDPRQAAALAPQRARLAKALAEGGRGVVSARVGSPTYGGASWLAHAALLSGVDTHQPGDYELLLTTQRPTLVSLFKARGWRTVNWMPGLQKPWPEGRFYAFDRYGDANSIGYRGPAIGHWRIPDQASMALLQAQELGGPAEGRAPRFMVFPTLASHAPFHAFPPYQPDWDRLLRADAYSPEQVAAAAAAPVSWNAPVPGYLASLGATFEWLGAYLAERAPKSMLTIVIGDHQPLASVSGQGASWDVPVHVISADIALLSRFEALGFVPGLTPPAESAGPMHGLTPTLMKAFSGEGPAPHGAAE